MERINTYVIENFNLLWWNVVEPVELKVMMMVVAGRGKVRNCRGVCSIRRVIVVRLKHGSRSCTVIEERLQERQARQRFRLAKRRWRSGDEPGVGWLISLVMVQKDPTDSTVVSQCVDQSKERERKKELNSNNKNSPQQRPARTSVGNSAISSLFSLSCTCKSGVRC